jgi:uncharacterized RDD family membrane protein YckC
MAIQAPPPIPAPSAPAPGFPDPSLQQAPGLARRLACFVYEGVVLFAVVMTGGYLFSSLTQQRHAMTGRHGLQAFLFLLLGIYFVWFWSRGGQTVAMKAWHIRVVDDLGRPITQRRATVRYILSWLWFGPALLWAWAAGLASAGAILALLAAGVLTYAASSWLHPKRQFWHDALSGTQLVTHRPTPRAKP